MLDKTGKFEVLASEYAKAIVRAETNAVITGYRWEQDGEIDQLLWFVTSDAQRLFVLFNETEDEEW